ncbi:Nuclear transport factor 2 [Coemansia sp. Benny D115]|nr:Nuclear transport factor 2 [Coemansia sp. Benny D115]
MSNINEIAKQFVDYYYQAFDSDRNNLAPLYVRSMENINCAKKPRRSVSMMTWEAQQLQGVEQIVEKLVSLPFQKVAHQITTIDAQQSLPNVNAIVIMVTGQLLVDDETKPQHFSQTFQLVEDNGFFVYNDIFRLNYA